MTSVCNGARNASAAASVDVTLFSNHLAAASGPAITLSASVPYLVSLIVDPVSGMLWLILPQLQREA